LIGKNRKTTGKNPLYFMREIGLDLEDTSECLTNNRKNRGQRDLLLLFF